MLVRCIHIERTNGQARCSIMRGKKKSRHGRAVYAYPNVLNEGDSALTECSENGVKVRIWEHHSRSK